MKKKELVPLDYVGNEIDILLTKTSKKVGFGNSVEISFFILGQILLDLFGEEEFKKYISLIRAGVKSQRKQRNEANKRKVG